MSTLLSVERRIDRMLGSDVATVDYEIPDDWICPFTGKIMNDPVIADDTFTYERENITNWADRDRRMFGLSMSPITGERMNISKLVCNRAVKTCIEEYEEYMKRAIQAATSTQREPSIEDVLKLRLKLSFRWVTKWKFTDEQVDIDGMTRRFAAHMSYEFWPMVRCKKRFLEAVLESCSYLRHLLYAEFKNAIYFSSLAELKIAGKEFFVQSMLLHPNDTKTKQLSYAMEECARSMKCLHDYQTRARSSQLHASWRRFWGEEPRRPAP